MKIGNETDAAAMARIQNMDVAYIDARGTAMHALHKRIYMQNDAVLAITLRPSPSLGPGALHPEKAKARSDMEPPTGALQDGAQSALKV
jgi:hypothetical protein